MDTEGEDKGGIGALKEHTISIRRRAQSWLTGDDHLMEEMPVYDLLTEERLDNMVDWATWSVLDAIKSELAMRLLALFRQSGSSFCIEGGHFRVVHEVEGDRNGVVVELSLQLVEMT